jgi:hypothetical protein
LRRRKNSTVVPGPLARWKNRIDAPRRLGPTTRLSSVIWNAMADCDWQRLAGLSLLLGRHGERRRAQHARCLWKPTTGLIEVAAGCVQLVQQRRNDALIQRG